MTTKTNTRILELEADFSLRIVLVEDDQSQYFIWDAIFKALHTPYVLDWATTYAEGEKIIKASLESEKAIDVIICDIFLKDELTGIDLWRKHFADARNFFITSGVPDFKFQVAMREEDKSKPMPMFIHKPLVPKECLKALRAVFKIQNFDPKN